MDKVLRRSADDKRIAGVCGGIAEYFDIKDVTWVRLIMALLLLAGGVSFWIYIICWIVMPLGPKSIGPVDNQ